MSTAQVSQREQRIEELVAGGRDRWSAENIVDGRPEWSQRSVDVDTRSDAAKRMTEEQSQRNAEIVAQTGVGLPTLQDLEIQLLDLEEQLQYWRDVATTAKRDLEECEDRLKAAKEVEVATAYAKGSSARHDREQALRTIERVTASLDFNRKRLANAETQVASRRKRLKEFPHAELKRLRKEDDRRQRMRGKF